MCQNGVSESFAGKVSKDRVSREGKQSEPQTFPPYRDREPSPCQQGGLLSPSALPSISWLADDKKGRENRTPHAGLVPASDKRATLRKWGFCKSCLASNITAKELPNRQLGQTGFFEERIVPVRSMGRKGKGQYQQHEIDGASSTNSIGTSPELSESHRIRW